MRVRETTVLAFESQSTHQITPFPFWSDNDLTMDVLSTDDRRLQLKMICGHLDGRGWGESRVRYFKREIKRRLADDDLVIVGLER